MHREKKLCLSLIIILTVFCLAFPVNAHGAALVQRISGDDRHETSVEISKSGWSLSENAVLATGLDFPDALCAAPLAKNLNAPILLTDSFKLDTLVEKELIRLKVKNIYIIGGYGAISGEVENKIKGMGIQSFRIYGSTRYDTSIEIANFISSKFGTTGEIAVATGENFPDALSIAPVSAARNIPILLAQPGVLSEALKKYIKDNKISRSYVIGGAAAVSDATFIELPGPERIKGSDRYSTNTAVLNRFSKELDFTTTYLATGRDFPDALSGSALAVKSLSPIVLTERAPEQVTSDFLTGKLSSINKLIIIGGEGAVLSSPVQDILLGGASNKTYAVAKVSGLSDTIKLVTVPGGINTTTLLPKAIDASGKEVEGILFDFASSNPSIAAVDSSGAVRAVSGGTCAVTVKTKNAVIEKSFVIILTVDSKMKTSDIAKLSSGVVYIEVSNKNGEVFATGSGFIISPDGKIITNYHVIDGAYFAYVVMEGGTRYSVDGVLSYSREMDIAVLKLEGASNLPVARLGDSSSLETGDEIVAIGSPIGYKNTVSAGIISGFRESELREGTDVQITAPISSGSSGGALFDMFGSVVGITYAVSTDGQNINFAIPINEAKPMLDAVSLTKLSEVNSVANSFMSYDEFSYYISKNYSTSSFDGNILYFDEAVVTDNSSSDSAFIFLTMYRESYGAFLKSIINSTNAKANIEGWMDSIAGEGARLYSGKDIYGSLWYKDVLESYPAIFPSDEISYDSASGMWLVDHLVLMFTIEGGRGLSFTWY